MTYAFNSPRPPTIVIAPNSFKGSLSAESVALAMEVGIKRVWPQADCKRLAMADGGEGTLEVITNALGGAIHTTKVNIKDSGEPQPKIARYGGLPDGTGLIEVADLVGWGQCAEAVTERTSFAVGSLLQQCLDKGIRRFLIGLGGSGTNDGGAGMLSALGVRYYDAQGKPVDPTPINLSRIYKIDFSGLDPRLMAAHITVMSDVDNILCGKAGATYVFGPQKGIARAELAKLDANIAHFAVLADNWAGRAVSQAAGTGAAGGIGYALQLVGGTHASGAEIVAGLIKLDDHLKTADWVLTGEGKSDLQTLSGKAPFIVACHAKTYKVPVTLISGAIDTVAETHLLQHFDDCFSLLTLAVSNEESMAQAAKLIADRTEQIARARVKEAS